MLSLRKFFARGSTFESPSDDSLSAGTGAKVNIDCVCGEKSQHQLCCGILKGAAAFGVATMMTASMSVCSFAATLDVTVPSVIPITVDTAETPGYFTYKAAPTSVLSLSFDTGASALTGATAA